MTTWSNAYKCPPGTQLSGWSPKNRSLFSSVTNLEQTVTDGSLGTAPESLETATEIFPSRKRWKLRTA